MSDIKGKYKKILEDLENNIKDEQDLLYTKEKFMELTMIFLDIVDRLTALTDARIKEVEEKQQKINEKIASVQAIVDSIEGDIYESDDSYEFEIVCPYCNYEFTTDIEDEEIGEVKCPNCNNIIELDWNSEEEYACGGDCSHCSGEQVAEDEEKYNNIKNTEISEDENKNEDEDM